jgi:hypothetical protein
MGGNWRIVKMLERKRESFLTTMHYSILLLMRKALIDEGCRFAATIWLLPWLQETVRQALHVVRVMNHL